MNKKTKEIIGNGIDFFGVYFKKQDEFAKNGFHLIIGQITIATKLGLISLDEMEYFTDLLFEKYNLLEK